MVILARITFHTYIPVTHYIHAHTLYHIHKYAPSEHALRTHQTCPPPTHTHTYANTQPHAHTYSTNIAYMIKIDALYQVKQTYAIT